GCLWHGRRSRTGSRGRGTIQKRRRGLQRTGCVGGRLLWRIYRRSGKRIGLKTKVTSSHPRGGSAFGCADRVAIVVRHRAIAARPARVDSRRQRRSRSLRRATRKKARSVRLRDGLYKKSGLAAQAWGGGADRLHAAAIRRHRAKN